MSLNITAEAKNLALANIDISQLDTVVVPSNDDESNLLSPTTSPSSAYQSNEPLHMISSMVSSCSSTFSTNSSSSNNLSVQCKMSEKVSSLTTAIYHELEQLIKDHGEHNYKMLMSLIISTLESLDVATHERDELDSEIDLLKEDREQLLTQWERERDLRKKSEEKYLQFEDLYEDRLKKQDDKSRKAQHALNLAEIKVKNALDHVSRLEDKEAEYKKNYAKLNERCNHLMRLNCENTERLRLNQPSTDNATGCSNAIKNRRQFSYSTESSNYLDSSASSRDINEEMFRNNSLPNNIPGAVTTGCSQGNKIQTVNIHNPFWEMAALDTQFEDFDFAEVRNSEDDNELCSLADDTSVCDSTGDTGITSSFFGMTKEVEKLINENNDLLATKNALNVLKDDLLEQLNEVTGKLKITECELNDAELNLKSKDNRICDLEVELKSERAKSQQTEIAEQNNNLSFTRADITRLITEKNLFKQKLMDLEDAIKWQDMLRSSKNKLINHSTTRKRTQIFNLFSSLFGSSLLTTNTSEVETNRTNDPFKSIPADIVKKNHNVKHCDSNEEESIHNDWLIPKDLQMATPMFIGKTILSKANIEQIRGHSTLFQNPSQIWITGAQSSNQQASRILVIDTNDVSQDEPLRLLYNCEVPYIVSSICQIPYASKRNEFYSQCEFCKRELSVKTNTLDDGYRLDFDSILLGTHDGRVLVIKTKLIDAKPLFSLNVKAAILTMKYDNGKVACGLSNGSVLVLHSDENEMWFSCQHTISLCPYDEAIRSLCFLPDGKLWAGMRNLIASIDQSLTVEKIFNVHPRRNSQIRHMICVKDLVVIAMRLDSTLRVFDANSQQHVQDIDLDPLERKIISVTGGKSGLSMVRVTSMMIGPRNHLYVGTSNGSIICIPLDNRLKGYKYTDTINYSCGYFMDRSAIVSIRGHRKDVQCLCCLQQGDVNIICSIGYGCKIYKDVNINSDTYDIIKEVTSKSICCMAWKFL